MLAGHADNRPANRTEQIVDRAENRRKKNEKYGDERQSQQNRAGQPAERAVTGRSELPDVIRKPSGGKSDETVKRDGSDRDVDDGKALSACHGRSAENHVKRIRGKRVDRQLDAHHCDPEDRKSGEQAPECHERAGRQLQGRRQSKRSRSLHQNLPARWSRHVFIKSGTNRITMPTIVSIALDDALLMALLPASSGVRKS